MSGAVATGERLRLEGLSVARGGRTVVARCRIDDPAGRGHRAARPQRRRQVLAWSWRSAACCAPRAGRVLAGRPGPHAPPPGADPRGRASRSCPRAGGCSPTLTVGDNLRVATYALARAEAEAGSARRARALPRAREALDVRRARCPAASSRWSCSPRRWCRARVRCWSTSCRWGSRRSWSSGWCPTLATVAESGVGVLLIEQFAHVALALANTAYVLEGGRIRYHGTASGAARQARAASVGLPAARAGRPRRGRRRPAVTRPPPQSSRRRAGPSSCASSRWSEPRANEVARPDGRLGHLPHRSHRARGDVPHAHARGARP